MTLEGAKVLCVSEIMPYSSGLKRNIAQCLNDFGIPLYLEHTVVEIEGKDRVTGVTLAKVDENKRPLAGTEKHFDCDTVLFSVGLIPENELTKRAGISLDPRTKGAAVDGDRETEAEGIFACGNVLHVHDLVDFVSEEAETAGRSAAGYVLNGPPRKRLYRDGKRRKHGVRAAAETRPREGRAAETLFQGAFGIPQRRSVRRYGRKSKKIQQNRRRSGEMESVTLSAEELAAAEYVKISVHKRG